MALVLAVDLTVSPVVDQAALLAAAPAQVLEVVYIDSKDV